MSVDQPVLTGPAAGETARFPGGSSTEMKVEATQSGGDYGAVVYTVKAGEEPPMHTHSREDELVWSGSSCRLRAPSPTPRRSG